LRKTRLTQLQRETRTIILYEAPHRLITTLEDLHEVMGDRSLVLARELTKLHEDLWRGNLVAALELYQNRQPKGEYTLVLEGLSKIEHLDENQLKQELEILLAQGMSLTKASQELTPFTTLSRREIYQLGIEKKSFAQGDRK
jgi:16S rRNA (cytidine1402-2'-O)-methyltransferase